jgi:hypothetical protein
MRCSACAAARRHEYRVCLLAHLRCSRLLSAADAAVTCGVDASALMVAVTSAARCCRACSMRKRRAYRYSPIGMRGDLRS